MNPLSILLHSPEFSTVGVMTIHALAPLSMVVQMPGKYYRSQAEPSDEMLYGLIENALGWHVNDSERNAAIKMLIKRHKLSETVSASGVGFRSLLQFHLRFDRSIKVAGASILRYDDYWSQHLRTGGLEFVGGSREHDTRLIPLMDRCADKASGISLTDSGGIRDKSVIDAFQTGDKINLAVVRPYFPRYYVTPTPREYVVPDCPYIYRVETSPALAELLEQALNDPAGPLYLGSNDGWVDVAWKVVGDQSK